MTARLRKLAQQDNLCGFAPQSYLDEEGKNFGMTSADAGWPAKETIRRVDARK
jgi:hypothetical protein